MTLNDLLQKHSIDPKQVVVMRHCPTEIEVRKVLPWLVHGQPKVFNAYQQLHGSTTEAALVRLVGTGYIASFVAMKPGQAVFAGLYKIRVATSLTYRQVLAIPEYQALRSYGIADWTKDERKKSKLWFDLVLQKTFYPQWSGRLVVTWPPPERSWWRRAERNTITVFSIREESAFTEVMPDWKQLVLTWQQLRAIPASWRSALSQWRGIYFIYDTADGKGYVGSAYGKDNLLGRWLNYASSGHGGNKLLLDRQPDHFQFSILQRVSPDMEPDEVIQLESSWKDRLHTGEKWGLNGN